MEGLGMNNGWLILGEIVGLIMGVLVLGQREDRGAAITFSLGWLLVYPFVAPWLLKHLG